MTTGREQQRGREGEGGEDGVGDEGGEDGGGEGVGEVLIECGQSIGEGGFGPDAEGGVQ